MVSLKAPFKPTAFDGRSDYGPFIANGVPAGGIFTGAEVVKSMVDRTIFGGIANAAFDPCYHQSCDTFDNVNMGALVTFSNATATVFYELVTNAATLKSVARRGPLPPKLLFYPSGVHLPALW